MVRLGLMRKQKRRLAMGMATFCSLAPCLFLAVPANAAEEKDDASAYARPTLDLGLEPIRELGDKMYIIPLFSYGTVNGDIDLSRAVDEAEAQEDEWEQSLNDWGIGGIIGFSLDSAIYSQARSSRESYTHSAFELRAFGALGDGDIRGGETQPSQEQIGVKITDIESERFSVAVVGLQEVLVSSSNANTGFYAGLGLGYSWIRYDLERKEVYPISEASAISNPNDCDGLLLDNDTQCEITLRAGTDDAAPEVLAVFGMRVYAAQEGGDVSGLFYGIDVENRFSYKDVIGHALRVQLGIGYAF